MLAEPMTSASCKISDAEAPFSAILERMTERSAGEMRCSSIGNALQKFFRGDRRGPEFSDHNTGRVVRKNGGFERRSAGRNGQRETRDHRISRPAHIENFPCHGLDMDGFFTFFTKEHALLA